MQTDPQEGGLITQYTATCHTEGCDNADYPVPVWLESATQVVYCGVCGQQITDVAGG